VSAATLSAVLDSTSHISQLERSEARGGEDGTLGGKEMGACIVWEKDLAGAKSSLVKRVSLNGKMPVVANAERISLGVIDRGCIFMYSGMML
jgi:hypothetical protein